MLFSSEASHFDQSQIAISEGFLVTSHTFVDWWKLNRWRQTSNTRTFQHFKLWKETQNPWHSLDFECVIRNLWNKYTLDLPFMQLDFHFKK